MPTLIKKNDCPPKMTRYALKVTQICHPLLGREEKCELGIDCRLHLGCLEHLGDFGR